MNIKQSREKILDPNGRGGGRDGRPVAPLFSPLSRRLQYGEVKTIDETVELKQEA